MSWFSWGSKAASPEPASPSTTTTADDSSIVVGRGQHHPPELQQQQHDGVVVPRSSSSAGAAAGGSPAIDGAGVTPTLSFGEGGGSSVSMQQQQHHMRSTRVALRLELRQSLDILTTQLARINLGAPTNSTLGGVATPTTQSGGAPNDRSRCYTVLRYYEAATLVGHIRHLLSALNQESQLDIARNEDDELEAAILHRDAMRCSQQHAEERKPLGGAISSFPLVCYSPLFTWSNCGCGDGGSDDDNNEMVDGNSNNQSVALKTITTATLTSLQDGINQCIGWDGSNHQSQSCTTGSDDFKALQTCIRRALLDRSDELEKLLLHAAKEVDVLSQQHPHNISDPRRHLSCVLLQCLITDLNRAALMLSTTTSYTTKSSNGQQYAALLSDMACFAKSIINKGFDRPQPNEEHPENNDDVVMRSSCDDVGPVDSDRQAILSSVVAEAMAAIDDALILSATVTPTPSPSTATGKSAAAATDAGKYCVLSGVAIPPHHSGAADPAQYKNEEEASGGEDEVDDENIQALRNELHQWIKSGSVHPFVGKYLLRVII